MTTMDMPSAATPRIYNVLVNGFSVGMTFNHSEAVGWSQHATSKDVKIIAVPYRMERQT